MKMKKMKMTLPPPPPLPPRKEKYVYICTVTFPSNGLFSSHPSSRATWRHKKVYVFVSLVYIFVLTNLLSVHSSLMTSLKLWWYECEGFVLLADK